MILHQTLVKFGVECISRKIVRLIQKQKKKNISVVAILDTHTQKKIYTDGKIKIIKNNCAKEIDFMKVSFITQKRKKIIE